jgi:hypothetical protein
MRIKQMADQNSAQEENSLRTEQFETENEGHGELHSGSDENQVGQDQGETVGTKGNEGEDHPEERGRCLIRQLNQDFLGVLTVHFPERDVKLIFDGDSALRLLTMFKDRTDRKWKDQLDPTTSLAHSGWCVLDLRLPLAISWAPIGSEPPRTAIDPH